MKRLRKGPYKSDRSDLTVEVHNVRYQNEEYAKIKATISAPSGFRETKNYKVHFKNIGHWKWK